MAIRTSPELELPSFIRAGLAELDEQQRCAPLSLEDAQRTAALAHRVAHNLHWLFRHGLTGYEPDPLADRPPRPIVSYRLMQPYLLTLGQPARLVPGHIYWPTCIAQVEPGEVEAFLALSSVLPIDFV